MSDFDFVINELPHHLLTQCPTVLYFIDKAVRDIVKMPHNKRYKVLANMILYQFYVFETLLAGLDDIVIDPLLLKKYLI